MSIGILSGSAILLWILVMFIGVIAGLALIMPFAKKQPPNNTDQKRLREDIENGLEALESWKPRIIWIVVLASLSLLGFLMAWYLQFNNDYSNFNKQWGEVGSYFGGMLSPFLSFITIIMLLYTLIQQQKGLLLSHRELEANRKEFEGQKEALQIQSDSFLVQNFESRLFYLLSNLIQNIKGITYAGTNGPEIGDKAIYDLLFKEFNIITRSTTTGLYIHEVLQKLNERLIENIFLSHMEQVKVIVKFIHSKNFDEKTKLEYFEIISSNIGTGLRILFYIHSAFNKDANSIIENTRFFKHLPQTIHNRLNQNTIDISTLKDRLTPSAF